MGYAARRAEIELLKGGQSIAVPGTTGWAARPGSATEAETTSPAARLGPATEVHTRSPRANAVAIAHRSGKALDRNGEAPVALCPTPCVNRSRNPERRCALSVDPHYREKMRVAPGVDAAMLHANEAKASIAEGTAQATRGPLCSRWRTKS